MPFSAASTVRAAEKVRLQNAALDAQREARAARVMGAKPTASHSRQTSLSSLPQRPSPSPAPPMARTLSGPAASTLGSGMGEKIPLKTRVVQFLALGPTTVDEILEHTQGDYNDVLRVANVIGLQEDGQYRLRPAQYAKIKIGSWKYSHDEKVRVIGLARQAFDELGLAPDAEERDELDQKEREALGSAGSGASASPVPAPAPAPAPAPVQHLSPVKQKQLSLSPQKQLPSLSRSASPAGAATTTTAAAAAPAPTKKAAKAAGPKSKVAKQIAKMRNDHLAKARSSSATGAGGPGASRVASPLPGADDSEDEKPLEKEREEKKERPPPPPKKSKGTATVSAAAAAAAGLPEKPVAAISAPPSSRAKPPSAENGKRGAAADKKPLSQREKRRSTHDYTSSDDSEPEAGEVRGRARTKKTVAVTKEKSNGKANGHRESRGTKRTSPVYTSSDDEAPPAKKRASPPEPPSLMGFKRKGSPNVTVTTTTTKVKKANGTSNGTPAARASTPTQPDPRSLRDKYERLYAEYERVGERLAGFFAAAERVRDGSPGAAEALSRTDVKREAERYEEMHRELEKIRAWFS